MRVILSAVNEAGRSHVRSCDVFQPPTDGSIPIVHDFEPNAELQRWIDAAGPDIAGYIGPQVRGGARVIFAVVPPHGFAAGNRAQGDEFGGIDEEGWHTTETIDFVFVVAGDLTLILEEETVQLEPGDLVVQQGTRHAWRNGERGSAHLAVMLRPVEPRVNIACRVDPTSGLLRTRIS